MSEWINAAERLPAPETVVYVLRGSGSKRSRLRSQRDNQHETDFVIQGDDGRPAWWFGPVTHWMKMPAPWANERR